MMSSARTRALPTARSPSIVVPSMVRRPARRSIGDAGRREGAVEDHRELDVAAAEIGRDRAGLDQPRGDAQILEPVLAEIDQTLGGERQRRGWWRAGGCRRGAGRAWW